MKLSVSERYILLDILPREGTYTTLKILRKLRESLAFSEEEVKKYSIVEEIQASGMIVKWNTTIPQESEINIGEKATEIIQTTLKNLDSNSKLTEREFSLFEKFIIA